MNQIINKHIFKCREPLNTQVLNSNNEWVRLDNRGLIRGKQILLRLGIRDINKLSILGIGSILLLITISTGLVILKTILG